MLLVSLGSVCGMWSFSLEAHCFSASALWACFGFKGLVQSHLQLSFIFLDWNCQMKCWLPSISWAVTCLGWNILSIRTRRSPSVPTVMLSSWCFHYSLHKRRKKQIDRIQYNNVIPCKLVCAGCDICVMGKLCFPGGTACQLFANNWFEYNPDSWLTRWLILFLCCRMYFL